MPRQRESKGSGVNITVPPKSTGRLVDALTDIIRPFSEARGLRADQIRLQREDVAVEIAKKARERLAAEKTKIKHVSNKILVPLIEAGSNEEIDDDYMIDLWANLLASAAKHDKVEPRFIGILRELQGRQAQMFERMALNNSADFKRPLAQLEDASAILEPVFVRQTLGDLFRSRKTAPEPAEIYAKVLDWIDRPGCAVIDVVVYLNEKSWSLDVQQTGFVEPTDAFDLEILTSLGLCRRVNEYHRSRFGHDIQVIYYHVTELGVRFFFSCKNLQPEPPSESREDGAVPKIGAKKNKRVSS